MALPWASRFVIVEGDPGCSAPVVEQAREHQARVLNGFLSGPGASDSVCVGTVRGADDAAAAVLAALDGARLILEAAADRDVIDRLIDDLRRLGAVDHRVGPAPVPVVGADPSASEARRLLGLLAEGYSLGEAAHLLGLSRRTADRRLDAARRALGVERTTEAIARARRLGWLRRSDDGDR